MAMGLCSRCSRFDIQAFARDDHPYRGYPLQAIVRAAKREHCSFCSMLLEHLTLIDEHDPFSHLNRAVRKETKESERPQGWWRLNKLLRLLVATTVPVWVHFSVKRGNHALPHERSLDIVQIDAFVSAFADARKWDEGRTNTIHLHVAADKGTPASTSGDITGTLSLDQHNWSWSHYLAIETWHNKCRAGHSRCNETMSGCTRVNAEDVPLPTRCVEFELIDPRNAWLSPVKWMLRETEGRRGKYIALSHRWVSQTKAARTTKKNYDCRVGMCNHSPDYHMRTAPGGITNLFSETGKLACHLGVKYVWIDSLCIVQDDNDDWARESVKMADYYQYSWLTVAATATSEIGGIFCHPDISSMPRVTRLPYRDESGTQNGHFYTQAAGNTALTYIYKNDVSNSELLKRGWVYQEWMLSRRLLTISKLGLFLQCQEGLPKSLDGYEVYNRRERYQKPAYTDLSFKATMKIDLRSSIHTVLAAWKSVVNTYSGLQITKLQDDRLVALAGIASEFGCCFHSKALSGVQSARKEYICGLWTGWPRGLLWEQAHSARTTRVEGFPTWSWLSIAVTVEDTRLESDGHTLSGFTVQWADESYLKKTDLCSVGQPIHIRTIGEHWNPCFDYDTEYSPENIYSNDNRFVILPVSGQLLSCLIGGTFDNEEGTAVAASMTAHHSDSQREMWRYVSLTSHPQTIVGWASIESPAHQSGDSALSDLSSYALIVTNITKLSGGYGLGRLSGEHNAFEVLLLMKRPVPKHDDCYERIGVGRLFGDALEKEIRQTSAVDIKLV